MEDKQYKELTDFIGGQFNRVWTEFDKNHSEHIDMKNDFRQLQSAVDDYATKADTYFMEMAALGSKLDRHERWIGMIAEKLGLKLPS